MSAVKVLSLLKEMMPKTPEVQDAFDTLEEEAKKGSGMKGTNDEQMGLELDDSDEDLGGEENPSDDDSYTDMGMDQPSEASSDEDEESPEHEAGESKDFEAGEDEESKEMSKLRSLTGKKKKK